MEVSRDVEICFVCLPLEILNAIAAVYLCSNCSRTLGKSAKRRVLVHSLMLRWTQGHGLGSEPGHGSMSAGIVLCHKILTRNFNGVSSNQHNFVMNYSLRKNRYNYIRPTEACGSIGGIFREIEF